LWWTHCRVLVERVLGIFEAKSISKRLILLCFLLLYHFLLGIKLIFLLKEVDFRVLKFKECFVHRVVSYLRLQFQCFLWLWNCWSFSSAWPRSHEVIVWGLLHLACVWLQWVQLGHITCALFHNAAATRYSLLKCTIISFINVACLRRRHHLALTRATSPFFSHSVGECSIRTGPSHQTLHHVILLVVSKDLTHYFALVSVVNQVLVSWISSVGTLRSCRIPFLILRLRCCTSVSIPDLFEQRSFPFVLTDQRVVHGWYRPRYLRCFHVTRQ